MAKPESQYIEKKVHYLGCWKTDNVDDRTITQINTQITSEKGSKAKLQLSSDGLRVVKTSIIQGKMLQDYVSLDRIQFMTVSRNLPDLLMVISVIRDGPHKYQIHAFRCANGLDAGMFVGAFRSLQRYIKPVKVVKSTTLNQKNGTNEEDINWTLRSKEHDNSKRELKQMADLHGERAVIHKVGEGGTLQFEETHEEPVMNGHTEVFENGVRIPLYRKGRPTRIERESFESEVSDNRSEVSESALRSELETLSQELRDIKLMLEKSTGVKTGDSEPNTPRDFEPVNVRVSHHVVKQDPVVIRASEMNGNDAVDAVVFDEENVQLRQKEAGYHVTSNGSVTHVRVNVPDYRNFSEGSPSYTVTTTSTTPRASTTSYENWKKNTMERNAIRYSDLPERIQWKSRSNRASHVVSARPRSALPSWSTDATDSSHSVEVRHHPAGYGPAYHRVSFNPRVTKLTDRKTQSLRGMRGASDTVIKPIDKVYLGRPEAKHHSLSRRPVSANLRPSILVREEGLNDHPQTITVEQNNNHLKPDNDDHLLDVSGIDLYKETPTEGAVIRT